MDNLLSIEKISEIITVNGIAIIYVIGTEKNVGFSYTIGMALMGKPDLVIIGDFKPKVSARILDRAASIVESDYPSALGVVKGISNVKMIVEPCIESKELFADIVIQAENFYSEMEIKRNDREITSNYLQIIWPDINGFYPTQRGFNRPTSRSDEKQFRQNIYVDVNRYKEIIDTMNE